MSTMGAPSLIAFLLPFTPLMVPAAVTEGYANMLVRILTGL